MFSIRVRCCAVIVAAVLVIFSSGAVQAAALPTFGSAGEAATQTLLETYYAGGGFWRVCNAPACRRTDSDWGADSATGVLYMRWNATHDPKLREVASELLGSGPRYPEPCNAAPCPAWSDTPAWDAVAFMRESAILGGDPQAIARAQAAFRYAARSHAFGGGGCPAIPYQQAQPNSKHVVKTLETDANLIKAALLLFNATHAERYLDYAMTQYAADRRTYLDLPLDLYTVHMIDAGGRCVQSPRRFFASVNGDMIWNGLQLARITNREHYLDEALATARAVDSALVDERGIFVDLQGENDVVEPLVEAMYDLASQEHRAFARTWILRNAEAALSARGADGTFSRFFDGPPQASTSIWESNGGLALEVAAAALDPQGVTVAADGWRAGHSFGEALTGLPATIAFDGSGIALVGTIGQSCETAHLRVFVDGVETFDRTGLWQNHAMPGGDSVRFAWRWSTPGHHVVRIEASKPLALGPNIIHLESVVLVAQ